ncbi:MAG: chorismate-binding protein [Rickettsiales bacterium]
MNTASSIHPDFAAFETAYKKGTPQFVWTKRVADLETPVSAVLKLREKGLPCFLLESVEGGEVRGRYSIIGLAPDLIWECRGTQAKITPASPQFPPSNDPMDSLQSLLDSMQMEIPEGLPPMAGAMIGYAGFNMIKLVEKLPNEKPDTIGIPDACFLRPSITVVFDSVDGVISVIAPCWYDAKLHAKASYDAAVNRISHILEKLEKPLSAGLGYKPAAPKKRDFQPNMTREAFGGMVEKAKEYIRAGDIFQVVLSQRFSADFTEDPIAFYRSLRHTNPSPFLFYLDLVDYALVGSSPEILVRLRDDVVTIRPIAGTRKRGKTREEDIALEKDLLADPKEIAEHLMLLDLGRNDVGRCTLPGTVQVTSHMQVERYSHVMHIVSNVEGRRDPKRTAFECLMSGFPAGTVSGAPKIRAMEIIDELEPISRSFYAGSVGYFLRQWPDGQRITLRTALIKDGKIYVQSGGASSPT